MRKKGKRVIVILITMMAFMLSSVSFSDDKIDKLKKKLTDYKQQLFSQYRKKLSDNPSVFQIPYGVDELHDFIRQLSSQYGVPPELQSSVPALGEELLQRILDEESEDMVSLMSLSAMIVNIVSNDAADTILENMWFWNRAIMPIANNLWTVWRENNEHIPTTTDVLGNDPSQIRFINRAMMEQSYYHGSFIRTTQELFANLRLRGSEDTNSEQGACSGYQNSSASQ